MNKYAVDFMKLIGELLPPIKRKPVRIAWLYRLMAWFRRIHSEFIILQASLEYQAKITSQVIIFESYLVDTFGAGITIDVNDITILPGIVYSSGGNDQGAVVSSSDQEEGVSTVVSTDEVIETYNFIVNVPAALGADLDQMAAIINKFKVPGSTYQIIES